MVMTAGPMGALTCLVLVGIGGLSSWWPDAEQNRPHARGSPDAVPSPVAVDQQQWEQQELAAKPSSSVGVQGKHTPPPVEETADASPSTGVLADAGSNDGGVCQDIAWQEEASTRQSEAFENDTRSEMARGSTNQECSFSSCSADADGPAPAGTTEVTMLGSFEFDAGAHRADSKEQREESSAQLEESSPAKDALIDRSQLWWQSVKTSAMRMVLLGLDEVLAVGMRHPGWIPIVAVGYQNWAMAFLIICFLGRCCRGKQQQQHHQLVPPQHQTLQELREQQQQQQASHQPRKGEEVEGAGSETHDASSSGMEAKVDDDEPVDPSLPLISTIPSPGRQRPLAADDTPLEEVRNDEDVEGQLEEEAEFMDAVEEELQAEMREERKEGEGKEEEQEVEEEKEKEEAPKQQAVRMEAKVDDGEPVDPSLPLISTTPSPGRQRLRRPLAADDTPLEEVRSDEDVAGQLEEEAEFMDAVEEELQALNALEALQAEMREERKEGEGKEEEQEVEEEKEKEEAPKQQAVRRDAHDLQEVMRRRRSKCEEWQSAPEDARADACSAQKPQVWDKPGVGGLDDQTQKDKDVSAAGRKKPQFRTNQELADLMAQRRSLCQVT